MFLIYGRKKAKIKSITDHIGACASCNSIGLKIEIYRDYFHLFWIPFFPVGVKESKVICTSCGKPNDYNPRVRDVEAVTRTPVYLFSGIILVVVLIALLVNSNLNTQKEKAAFIAEPKVGDVYLIRKEIHDSTFYYFSRVALIQSDTVIVYPNTLQYFRFTSRLNDEDYFLTEEFYFTKAELKQMLEKGEINSVYRTYGDYEGFDRIRSLEADTTTIDSTYE